MLWKNGLVEEYYYFVGIVLVQVRYVFLLYYLLVLSLFKPRDVGVFWNKKKSGPNRENVVNIEIGKK